MDSQHPLGAAHDCLHNNLVPPFRGYRMDIAQPPQGCCLRCLRHQSQTERHPLCWRLIHHLHGPRGNVHRHHHEALSSCMDLLRLPLPRHTPRRRLSPLAPRLRRLQGAQAFDKLTHVSVHPANGLCDQQSRFAPLPQSIKAPGYFRMRTAVSIAYVRTQVCDHSFSDVTIRFPRVLTKHMTQRCSKVRNSKSNPKLRGSLRRRGY
jgi:hypothetical protein